MRILVLSSLYPSAVRPRHGIFVETRLRHFLVAWNAEVRVIAPVPWFPFEARAFGEYGLFARTPRGEIRHGIPVEHPRYPMLPEIGVAFQPLLMMSAVWPPIVRLVREGFQPDLVDAHYFYPDGVAAALIARRLNTPFVVTARGTDVNVIAQRGVPRRWVVWAGRRATRIVAVSRALKEQMSSLGIPSGRVEVLRNGVDLEMFKPCGREVTRARLGVGAGPLLISVGHLVADKGHHLIVAALAWVRGAKLLIVGEGPERARLIELAHSLGLADRVEIAPTVSQDALAALYSAADVLVLASSREGWPNVLLEAMACGTPVVATDVGGVPEIVRDPDVGRIVLERRPEKLAEAITRVLATPRPPEAIRAYAAQFGWREVADRLGNMFQDCIATRHGAPRYGART